MMSGPLGRREPTDWVHVEKYPLQLTDFPQAIGQPVVFGIPWYEKFDEDGLVERKNKYGKIEFWLPEPTTDWGRVRGGHAILAEPAGRKDRTNWWLHYHQHRGSCTGHSSGHSQTLNNRRKYDPEWIYEQAQLIDEWPGEDYEGSSVRAAFDVLRDLGLRRVWGSHTSDPSIGDGIIANRWLLTTDEVLVVLQMDHAVLLQSWGRGYPHRVHASAETIERLRTENSEFCVATDR